ncbi:MAG TPA: hypothetical protein VLH56_11475 [Dissulfurispiraceae bacterium]|nr:hypothetical protein [Dissulfurispiraceae bacterium]
MKEQEIITESIIPSSVMNVVKAQKVEVLASLIVKEMDRETRDITRESQAALEHAQQISVKTEGDLTPVTEFIGVMKNRLKMFRDHCGVYVEKLNYLHKSATGFRKQHEDLIQKAIDAADMKAKAFLLAERERIRKEQERIDREAREREEKERQKLLAQAAKAEDKGQSEKAADLMEKAESVYVPSTILAGPAQTVKTDAGSRNYRAEYKPVIKDIKAICEAVYYGRLPISIVKIQEVELKRHCKSFQVSPIEARKMGFDLVEDLIGSSR